MVGQMPCVAAVCGYCVESEVFPSTIVKLIDSHLDEYVAFFDTPSLPPNQRWEEEVIADAIASAAMRLLRVGAEIVDTKWGEILDTKGERFLLLGVVR